MPHYLSGLPGLQGFQDFLKDREQHIIWSWANLYKSISQTSLSLLGRQMHREEFGKVQSITEVRQVMTPVWMLLA